MTDQTTEVDICVCTFRRPQIAETLQSLAAQEWPEGYRGRIIVVDNDDTPSARGIVEAFAETADLCVRYVHRPGRNISIARNAALEASDADLLAFIDDDETAQPDWIACLIEALAVTRAQAVLGPVRAVYAAEAPGWMKQGEVHGTQPVWVKGEIRTGYTCNVLLDRRSAAFDGLRFDPGLGRSGGEDSQFFSQLYRAGGRISFAPQAWLSEPVPADRATLSWLLRRRWRMGLTHAGSVIDGRGAVGKAKAASLALGKALICGAGAAVTLPAPLHRNRFLMRATLHLGVVWGVLGGAAPALYGQTAVPGSADG